MFFCVLLFHSCPPPDVSFLSFLFFLFHLSVVSSSPCAGHISAYVSLLESAVPCLHSLVYSVYHFCHLKRKKKFLPSPFLLPLHLVLSPFPFVFIVRFCFFSFYFLFLLLPSCLSLLLTVFVRLEDTEIFYKMTNETGTVVARVGRCSTLFPDLFFFFFFF